MVRLHRQYEIVREVHEEKLWLKKLQEHLSSNQNMLALQEPVEKFFNELWSNEENGRVFGVEVKDAMHLSCDRWFTDDLIQHFFTGLNTASGTHVFLVFDQLMKNASNLLGRVHRLLKPETKYLHFALNVKGFTTDMKSTTETTIGNGNHWVYVLIPCDGGSIIYGDPKGWNVPNNLRACFDPLLVMLRERNGCKDRQAVELIKMHIPQAGLTHNCVGGCNKSFPIQTCQSLCGGIVVLICSTAVLLQDLWAEIIFGTKCHFDQ